MLCLLLYRGFIMIDQALLRRIANADTDSKYWGSAVQEKAQEILDILCARSWQDDDFLADRQLDWAEYEYLEFVRLLKSANLSH
jgi:hypothetical protein